MTYSQVWWPIFRFCALHLPIQSAHTQQWTHTHTHTHTQPKQWAAIHAVVTGEQGSVPSRSSQSWYWGWRERSPLPQSLPDRDSNSQPFNYESKSLTIRPRLPHEHKHIKFYQSSSFYVHCKGCMLYSWYFLWNITFIQTSCRKITAKCMYNLKQSNLQWLIISFALVYYGLVGLGLNISTV